MKKYTISLLVFIFILSHLSASPSLLPKARSIQTINASNYNNIANAPVMAAYLGSAGALALGVPAIGLSVGSIINELQSPFSMLKFNMIKGSIGETIAQNYYFNRLSPRWLEMPTNMRSQGLDHLMVQTRADGIVTDLLVGETKFGSSQLSNTAFGKQGSPSWIIQNIKQDFIPLVKEISTQLDHKSIQIGSPPSEITDKIIKLPTSNESYFWKLKGTDHWSFEGTKEILHSTNTQNFIRSLGTNLEGVVDNKITFRTRLARVTVNQELNSFSLSISNMNGEPVGGTIQIPGTIEEFITNNPNVLEHLSDNSRSPLTPKEIAQVIKNNSQRELTKLRIQKILSSPAGQIGLTAAIGLTVSMISQLIAEGKVSLSTTLYQTGEATAITSLSLLSGKVLQKYLGATSLRPLASTAISSSVGTLSLGLVTTAFITGTYLWKNHTDPEHRALNRMEYLRNLKIEGISLAAMYGTQLTLSAFPQTVVFAKPISAGIYIASHLIAGQLLPSATAEYEKYLWNELKNNPSEQIGEWTKQELGYNVASL